MKKILLLIGIIFLLFAAASCTNEPDALTILADDVYKAPAGEYTLRYTITDYEKYRESYNLQISVNVYDENNSSVTVENNRTVKLAAEKTYTVVVRLTGNVKGKNISRSKQFTIETVKNDLTVSFILKDGLYTKTLASREVTFGETISIADIPAIVLFYAEQNDREGYSRVITEKKWVVYDDDTNFHELTQDDLTDITSDVNVYSHYEYDVTIKTYTVQFEMNGGAEKEPAQGTINDTFYRPATPVREGYVFMGFCTDPELTEYYNWKKELPFSSDMTLYAKWAIDNRVGATSDAYFDFYQDLDNFGNPYCKLSVKTNQKERLPEELILPSCHNGVPVRDLAQDAFSGSAVKSVFIPETYTLNTDRAFASCKKLETVVFESGNIREILDPYTFFDCTALTSVTFPDHLVTLDEGCFSGCISLTEITLPNAIGILNDKAFSDNKSLTEIAIPDSLVYIYDKVFDGCNNLTTVTFSSKSGIKVISATAFDNTAITELYLPAAMKDKLSFDNHDITVKYFTDSTETE